MDLRILHNPRCSKSRETLKLLWEKGKHPEVIPYLIRPPSEKLLSEIIDKLQIEPKALIRFKESVARQMGLSPSDTRPDQEWLKLMIENPILIERPIVFTSEKAVIGRPPENVFKIIGP